MRHGIKLSKKQSPKTDEELKRMSDIPYASAVCSIQYVVQCTRPDVAYAEPVVIFCDNNGAIAQAKEPRSHHRFKHILRCYHLLREMVSRGDCRMDRVSSAENTADPLTKPMSQVVHTQYLDKMGLRSMGDCL
ncbi:UNVERIFIED_CONTAM: Retrovirus-related Pol polyprotein from transposon RE2 [Sesamum latifolium]|uniref:Retrovirus-related Pol polyprotein from transposon RE2 n=1 Tax=Sesamum latifolium TaxID=2727402 RepID=A0AAW2WBE8_9LAMI